MKMEHFAINRLRKRRRRILGKLVCWACEFDLAKNDVSLVREIRELEKRNRELNLSLLKLQHKPLFSSPFSAVPPKDLLMRADLALDLSQSYYEFSKVLAEHYGIEAPQYLHDANKVPEGAYACYYVEQNKVYSRSQTLDMQSAFHEFWHALEGKGIVTTTGYHTSQSEKNADLYAQACMKLLGSEKE